jgi:AcrR family transcriptional regulator
MTKRTYRGTIQAEVAALTRQRIILSTLRLVEEEWIEDVTLQRIAKDAGVTVQTILRHFGDKEGLLRAGAEVVKQGTILERDVVPVGDLDAIVDYLVNHYEEVGDRMMRLTVQEERYKPLHDVLEMARVIHREWVSRVFSPWLASRSDGKEMAAQFVAITDLYMWKLLRRDMALEVEDYRRALHSMLRALLRSLEDKSS